MVPTTQIKNEADLQEYLRSPQHEEFLAFLEALNKSIANKKISDDVTLSPVVLRILDVLTRMGEWVEEIPPIQQPMRYGNKAFKDWFCRLQDEAEGLMLEILPDDLSAAAPELAVYLRESVGNQTRIDYGTGHETCFAAWLYCLAQIGAVAAEDFPALVARVFHQYVQLMRKLQRTYYLEPAGSHGVWSLDDYCFLPFYFGSSQLLDHARIKPRSIHAMDVLEACADDYMYLDSILFIHKMKTGPFGEHSPILNDVSGVKSWHKINGGMMKMYKVEVVGKFPIMQHFLFGSILRFKDSASPPPAED